ncbi:MAG: DUF4835 family protein [Lewinella sp.]|nr:DUF4835 family protein [Lewinella sp.]
MKRLFTILVLGLVVVSPALRAQELNASVRINTQVVTQTDLGVFETLERSINEFLNDQKWTNDIFEPEERIDCNFILTIQEEVGPTTFKVDLAVQSSRPIYDSDQSTPLLNFVDQDVVVEYEQYQPLNFSQNAFNNNLTSTLAFYVYIILGMDYDSFSPLGGEEFFQIAQDIVNSIPSNAQGAYKGWNALSASQTQGRYWILENMLSPRVRALRMGWYQYHRLGMDQMTTDLNGARAAIAEVIQTLGQVDQSYPNSMIVQLFLNAKRQEIIEIFKRGTITEQSNFIQTMSRVDPSNTAQYRSVR